MSNYNYPESPDSFDPPVGGQGAGRSSFHNNPHDGDDHHIHHERHYLQVAALQGVVGYTGDTSLTHEGRLHILEQGGGTSVMSGYAQGPFSETFGVPLLQQNGSTVTTSDGNSLVMGTVTALNPTTEFISNFGPFEWVQVDWSLYVSVASGPEANGVISLNPMGPALDLAIQCFPDNPSMNNFLIMNPMLSWSGYIAGNLAYGVTAKVPYVQLLDMVGNGITDQIGTNDSISTSGTYYFGMGPS